MRYEQLRGSKAIVHLDSEMPIGVGDCAYVGVGNGDVGGLNSLFGLVIHHSTADGDETLLRYTSAESK